MNGALLFSLLRPGRSWHVRDRSLPTKACMWNGNAPPTIRYLPG